MKHFEPWALNAPSATILLCDRYSRRRWALLARPSPERQSIRKKVAKAMIASLDQSEVGLDGGRSGGKGSETINSVVAHKHIHEHYKKI